MFCLFFLYNYDVTIFFFFSKLDLLRVRFAICAASPRFCAAAPHAFGPLQDHAEWLSRRWSSPHCCCFSLKIWTSNCSYWTCWKESCRRFQPRRPSYPGYHSALQATRNYSSGTTHDVQLDRDFRNCQNHITFGHQQSFNKKHNKNILSRKFCG